VVLEEVLKLTRQVVIPTALLGRPVLPFAFESRDPLPHAADPHFDV
jgi:hypothetical protein